MVGRTGTEMLTNEAGEVTRLALSTSNLLYFSEISEFFRNLIET